MDVNELRALNVDGLETFADRWAGIHRKLKQARTDLHDDVVTALQKDHWIGKGGKAAQSYCEKVQSQIDALDAEVRSLRSFLDTTADGAAGRKGVKGLEGHQKAVVEYCRQAQEKGMSVGAKGDVEWSEFRAPGPLSPEEKTRLDKKDRDAKELERKIKKELAEATEIDQQLARDLKVIFGTPDNFGTEGASSAPSLRRHTTSASRYSCAPSPWSWAWAKTGITPRPCSATIWTAAAIRTPSTPRPC